MSTRYEFDPVGPILLKHPLGGGWDLLHIMRWVGSWLLIYLASASCQVERRFLSGSRTATHLVWSWVPLHCHPVVHGHLELVLH